MKFKVNNDIWEVKFLGADELLALFRAKEDERANYVFGVTIRSEHVIYINGEMNKDQQIKTLKHELTHCYIWNYGLFFVEDVNEEVVCDVVACSNDFINEVVEKFKKEML